MTHPTFIVGAGLAGLIAAHAWPQARILEAAPGPRNAHRALLRFRTDAVSRLTGIPFRKVRVHKGIWFDGAYHQPNIQLANLYAAKVTGKLLGDRSIWNLDAVDRYVAPEDLYEQLLGNVGPRIDWATTLNDWCESADKGPIVSTAPLPVTLRTMDAPGYELRYDRMPIRVERYELQRTEAYQTVYFCDSFTQLYRASITGNLLICEFVDAAESFSHDPYKGMLERAFGLQHALGVPLEAVTQSYGKIAPIDDATRRRLLFTLTHEHGIYSLGRFATWRNILLDDVVNDIDVIKRLLRNADGYELRRSA